MSADLEPQTYSAPQAARVLGVSRETVVQMVRTKRLPSIDTGTRNLVIPRWAVDRLVAPPETVTITISPADTVEAAS
jgi:excisionase family DNA binding protein